MSYRILIVEDERGIAESIANHMAQWELEPEIPTLPLN